MHENTKRLRTLMLEFRLDYARIAEITGRKLNTVRTWHMADTERVMPLQLLQLVELTVGAKAKPQAKRKR